MKSICRILIICILFVGLPIAHLAQQNFNFDEYQQFIAQHENMTVEQLLQMHDAGQFRDKFYNDPAQALFYDSICIKYNLTEDEKALLAENGFVVSQRLATTNIVEQLAGVFHKDLPVYVSSDAILHAFHLSYDNVLKEVEEYHLVSRLTELLTLMKSKQQNLHTQYGNNPEMLKNLEDIDVYLTVPLALLNENASPFYTTNESVVNNLLAKIADEQMVACNIFGQTGRQIDFSQFKPRGHYETDYMFNKIDDYFRAMIWLGRIEFYLIAPKNVIPPVPAEVVQRQIIDTKLLFELYNISGASDLYNEIDSIIEGFVGEQDNVAIEHMMELFTEAGINSANDLLDTNVVKVFQDTLASKPYAAQQILSQVLIQGASEEPLQPASAFMLFGQRFVIDSYITGQVVFPNTTKFIPNILDVLAGLGNDAALQLLEDELDQFNYSPDMAGLRYLVDSYDTEFWESTIFNGWLNSIRKLNPPADRSNLPLFMQTTAWWQHKMNTQLSSWSELRHDNILYAKQSYTGGTVCSYPYSFVEPVPEFYASLKATAESTKEMIEGIDFASSGMGNMISSLYGHWIEVCDTLESVAGKQLNGTEFSDEEKQFLQRMLVANPTTGCGGDPYSGWYPQLVYWGVNWGNSFEEPVSNSIVVDYHTIPTDEAGAMVGWVKHAGTGDIDLAILTADLPGTGKVAFAGPVLSLHEYRTNNFERLTDSEWRENFLNLSTRPDWVNIYLADPTGNKMPEGPTLITSVERKKDTDIPADYIITSNYPNPFNPSTKINFIVPASKTNALVKLNVYNIQGQLIKSLVNENLQSGNYIVTWNGDNQSGVKVSSGVYIYEVRIENLKASGKMTLMK